ncbi:MAG: 1,4-alpha-glucan branching protein GlgB, partial [Chitinophagaceae bacterium]
LVLLNLNPVPKEYWEVVVDKEYTEEIFNSDDLRFWGTGNYLNKTIKTELVDEKKKQYRLTVKLPPLAGVVLK